MRRVVIRSFRPLAATLPHPDNVDWPTAERDCLVKAGLLPEGTTVEEMDEWYLSQGPGSQSQLAHQCSQDALGYLGGGQSGD